ncbi:AIPR family protein [Halosquirtibacter xylanolyticus]|uniref:AIPR family protein n=1 Tax=Halosquirtibacter xylanolyticus TaxID=3374599 RepID=UPI0037479F0F|nr:AIPR family protein [Prolixibacteraceae bacterium]
MSKLKPYNIDLEKYQQEMFHEVESLVYSDEEGDTKENKFTSHVLNILNDAEETESCRVCFYLKENTKEQVVYKINGYSLDDQYENIDIFISSYKDTNELYELKKSDVANLLKWSSKFVNDSIKGYLEELEPSSEAYGLAKILFKNRNDIIRVNLFVLTNGIIKQEFDADYKVKNLDSIYFSVNIWDIERFQRLHESQGNREPIEIDLATLDRKYSIPCLKMPSYEEKYDCYLAIIEGSLLSLLYRNYGTKLLESNVRAFLQQAGKINKGMRETIQIEPGMFLPYNNGLSATAQNVVIETKDNQQYITSLKDFQIVNGGQTTASLFHTERKYKADLNRVYVQMKLTEIKDVTLKNDIVPKISRYANSQNKVSEVDLTSNHPFLQRLEELSRVTYAINPENRNKQTIWFFERVRGQYKESLNKEPTKSRKDAFSLKYPKNQIIIKSDVSKYQNLLALKPFMVSRGAQKNYVDFIKHIKEGEKDLPGRTYWEDLIANSLLFKAIDQQFGRKGKDAIGDTNIKSHTVAYTISFFHHITKNKLNFEQIWNKQEVSQELIVELRKLLIVIYEYLTSLNVALVSEAAKKEKTWEDILKQTKAINPMDMDVVKSYLITERDYRKRYAKDKDSLVVEAKLEKLARINNIGLKFWDGLCLFMMRHELYTDVEQNIIISIRGKLKTNKNLTQREIDKGQVILDKFIKEGTTVEDVEALSKVKQDNLLDPASLHARLKQINSSTWQRIISLGEKSGALSYKQVSTIRVVSKYILKGEEVDIQRITIVKDALDIVSRKFKMNV